MRLVIFPRLPAGYPRRSDWGGRVNYFAFSSIAALVLVDNHSQCAYTVYASEGIFADLSCTPVTVEVVP